MKAKLAGLQVRMEAATAPAEAAGAAQVARMMQATAPVDTGYLRSSIGVDGSSAVAKAPYAAFAPPFAATAAHQAEPAVVAAMSAVIKTAVRSI